MKIATSLAAFTLLSSSAPGFAAALDGKSLAPAWVAAGQDEKDAWLQAFKFKSADADRSKIAECLDDYAAKPLFTTNALGDIASLCETVIEAEGRGVSK
jgi:hypothetical protein